MIREFIAAGFAIAFATSAMGHEGHGVPGQGNTVAHFAFNPLHLPLLIVLCLAAIRVAVCARMLFLRSHLSVRR